MKYMIVMLSAFALLLAGCASSPPAAVPAAPENTATPSTTAGNAQVAQPPAELPVSMALLAEHNKETDCWVGYNEQVYDITTFIPNHKNYTTLIVPLCGTADEFKKKFEGKHGLSKVSVLEGQPLMGDLDSQ